MEHILNYIHLLGKASNEGCELARVNLKSENNLMAIEKEFYWNFSILKLPTFLAMMPGFLVCLKKQRPLAYLAVIAGNVALYPNLRKKMNSSPNDDTKKHKL